MRQFSGRRCVLRLIFLYPASSQDARYGARVRAGRPNCPGLAPNGRALGPLRCSWPATIWLRGAAIFENARLMHDAHLSQPSMLRLVREARGYTGREFAARCALNPGLVSRLERGLVEPWPAFRRRAAQLLRVDEGLLFGEEPG
jgi:hypothetical protein